MCHNLYISFLLIIATSCVTKAPDSYVTCDLTNKMEYVIRWDIFPTMNGVVKIYASTNPSSFDTSKNPVAVAPINNKFAKFASTDSLSRFYFLIDFNGKFSRIVGTRGACMKSARIFRDLGGYKSSSNKRVKWGMIFRSGIIDTINNSDKERFARLGIKTIIDFRTAKEIKYDAKNLGLRTIVHLPVEIFDDSKLKKRILSGEFRCGDARVFMQDFYISQLNKPGQEVFELMFDILTREENYPIVIASKFGKGYCDIASALILSAIGVSEDFILEDYTWANQYLDSALIKQRTCNLNPNVREGVLTIMRNDRRDILCTFDIINRRYGSVQSFITNQLNVTQDQNIKLRNILLKNE
ncbi:MAG: tyrosine-protein phosphatase [Bacteroidales bacterium]